MRKNLLAIAILFSIGTVAYSETSAAEDLLRESEEQAAATDDAGYLDWAVRNVNGNAPVQTGTITTTTVTVVTQTTVTRSEPEPAPVTTTTTTTTTIQPAPEPQAQNNERQIVNVNVIIHNIWSRIPGISIQAAPEPARPAPAPVTVTTTTVRADRPAFGGFGGPVRVNTHLYGNAVTLNGGQGAFIFNHTLLLGGAGYGISQNEKDLYQPMSFGYGGAFVGLRLFGKSPLHVTFTAFAGIGGMGYETYSTFDSAYKSTTTEYFAVLEPGAEIGLTLFKFIEFSAGVKYRYVYGMNDTCCYDDVDFYSMDDLNGYSTYLSVTFGAF